ncbi:MAG: cation:proton antiporter [Kiritimatiellae bacterium]|nr:cation:proton antiporter [Kiritimatiellia bacterium]
MTLNDPPTFGILLILGIGVFGGVLGAWLFQKLRIPQVIGYIAIGLMIGETGFGILKREQLTDLRPFNFLALAVIGFLVGGELERKNFKQYGRQFLGITFGEGLTSLLMVGGSAGALVWYLPGDPRIALATAAVLGAISASTDPASPMYVLCQIGAKVMLTTSMVSVIALDDALAMILYTLGTAAAAMLIGSNSSLGGMLVYVATELFGSVILGGVIGLLLDQILRHSKTLERSLTVMVGSLLLMAGICLTWHLDVILCSMAAGVIMVNRSPARTHSLFKTLREFATPIQVMFFVLVGARFHLAQTPTWIWGLVGLYVVGSMVGKYTGSWAGAKLSGSLPSVRNYLGLGLFAQGGVAVGLSMMAAQHLSGIEVRGGMDLGTVIVTTVTATTLIMQVLGPPCTKFALVRADEAGRNVTEEDMIAELRVSDLLKTDAVSIPESTLLSDVFKVLKENNQLAFPIVDETEACIGVISLESLRELFTEQEIWEWMIAGDVMVPVVDIVTPTLPLEEAIRRMKQIDADQTIVRDPISRKSLGLFDLRQVHREVTRRLMERQGVIL